MRCCNFVRRRISAWKYKMRTRKRTLSQAAHRLRKRPHPQFTYKYITNLVWGLIWSLKMWALLVLVDFSSANFVRLSSFSATPGPNCELRLGVCRTLPVAQNQFSLSLLLLFCLVWLCEHHAMWMQPKTAFCKHSHHIHIDKSPSRRKI